MKGLARNLFQQKIQKSSLKGHPKHAPKESWPLIEQFVAAGYFSYLDYAFAMELLKDSSVCSEEAGVFLCYLFLCMRLGHLCVKIEGNEIYPDPVEMLSAVKVVSQELSPLEVSREDLSTLKQKLIQGRKLISDKIMGVVEEDQAYPKTPLCCWNNYIYIQRQWVDETFVLSQIKGHLLDSPALQADLPYIRTQLDAMLQSKKLLPEQSEAIWHACQRTLTLITGGPGTGKTYTAGQLVNLFWTSMKEDERLKFELVLAAPTGKAASRLLESLSKVIEKKDVLNHLSCKTLHSLLGIRNTSSRSYDDDSARFLTADLVIVDECSMIDAGLMKVLLKAIKKGSRLILLGDKDQLPPVEAGNLFADLVTALGKSGAQKPLPFSDHCSAAIRLSKCMRSDLQGILSLADSINKGDCDSALKIFESPREEISRILLKSEEDIKAVQKKIVEMAVAKFTYSELIEDFERLFYWFSRFRILCPLRQGMLGVDVLNELCRVELEKIAAVSHLPFVAPIMITVNDYRNDLHNGEMGVLIVEPSRTASYALFPSKNDVDGQTRRFPVHRLPKFDYAYCITVHKSQGSEFDEILIVMPEGAEFFGREVLYTAVTRAKKALHLYGKDSVIKAAIAKRGNRHSGLVHRFS